MDAIVPEGFYDLQAGDKEGVIREMIEALVRSGQLNEGISEIVVNSVLERENSCSTGIMNGVGVPHTKHVVIDKLLCAVGRSVKGIEYQSQDGQPVFILFLLLSAKSQSGEHLERLAVISKILRNEKSVQSLRNAGSIEELRQLVLKINPE